MTRNRPQSHRTNRFPGRLHDVLEDALSDPALAKVISWEPSGTAFKIHDQTSFVAKVIPRYFPKMKSYKSFRRQLNLYGLKVQNPAESTHSTATRINQDNLSMVSKTKIKVRAVKNQRNEAGKVLPPVLSSGIYSHPLLRRGRNDLVEAIPRSILMPTPMASTIRPLSQQSTTGATGQVVVFTTPTPAPPGSSVTAFAAAAAALPPPLAALVLAATATTSTNIMQHRGEKQMEKRFSSDKPYGDTSNPVTTPRSPFIVVSPQATATKKEEAGQNVDPLLGLAPMMLGEVINANMNYSNRLQHFHDIRRSAGMFIHPPSTYSSTSSHEGSNAASWTEGASSTTTMGSHQTLQNEHQLIYGTNCSDLPQEDIYTEIIRTFC